MKHIVTLAALGVCASLLVPSAISQAGSSTIISRDGSTVSSGTITSRDGSTVSSGTITLHWGALDRIGRADAFRFGESRLIEWQRQRPGR